MDKYRSIKSCMFLRILNLYEPPSSKTHLTSLFKTSQAWRCLGRRGGLCYGLAVTCSSKHIWFQGLTSACTELCQVCTAQPGSSKQTPKWTLVSSCCCSPCPAPFPSIPCLGYRDLHALCCHLPGFMPCRHVALPSFFLLPMGLGAARLWWTSWEETGPRCLPDPALSPVPLGTLSGLPSAG